MVDLEVDTNNASLAGQAIDICLKLEAKAEFSHKVENRHDQFLLFLKERSVSNVFFANKVNRFGCLSRAAAFYYEHLIAYLDQNPGVNNRLAGWSGRFLPYLT